MPKWITDHIGACLVGLLIFSLLLTVTGFVVSWEAKRQLNAFALESRSVTGVVSDKYGRTFAGTKTYFVAVSFRLQDGSLSSGSTEVTDAIFDRSQTGNPIRVTYVQSRPDWFYVGDDGPSNHDAVVFTGIFRYAIIGSLVVLILLGTFVFWPTQSERGDSSGADASRPLRQQPQARTRDRAASQFRRSKPFPGSGAFQHRAE